MNKRNNNHEITYAQFIVGALLKFDAIDNVDFYLLANDLTKETNTAFLCHYYKENIGKYVICNQNGTTLLKNSFTLDSFIEAENCTIRQLFLKIAGNRVNNYFDKLDVEKYRKTKEKVLDENKTRILNEANVLLISDIEDDYNELIKYGFKKVNYFKSIIRADKFFSEHPDELEKYHIILKGHQSVQNCCFEGDVKLDSLISSLENTQKILYQRFFHSYYPDHIKLETTLRDKYNHRYWGTCESTYSSFFDKIVENTLINRIFDTIDLKKQEFIKYEDYINPNRIPLPTKKENLKILYLDAITVTKFAKQISEELGLNIDFKEDDNYGLGKYVKSHLGDYDIIIASSTYSHNLIEMNDESTEQCKDTGRELTLLVSYDDIRWGIKDFAESLKLNYRFGGNIAPDSSYHSKEFRVLRYSVETKENDEYYTKMRSIIEATVNFYNQALIEKEKLPLSDLDFKNADQFDDEYVSYIEALEAKKEAELAPIRVFDDITHTVSSYLRYQKAGLINKSTEGLKITEGKDGIKVENIFQGRTLCAMIFKKENPNENLKVFEIQTLSKKGTLSSPKTIGLYTSKYDILESIPKKPDEKEQNALISIQKKINTILKPLNEVALNRKIEQEKSIRFNKKKY